MKKTFGVECQLLRWTESSNGGCTVVLQLAGPDDLAHFKALQRKDGKTAGTILMAAFSAVEESETQEQERPAAKNVGFNCGPLCKLAIQLCESDEFHAWLAHRFPDAWERSKSDVPSERAKQLILNECGIDSRKKLDTDKSAADWFHRYIRLPFINAVEPAV